MAATSLSSGAFLGTLASTGSSPVFSTVANQPALVVVGLSRLAASITPALMKSTDGGSTWAPVAMTSPGPAFNSGYQTTALPSTFFSVALLDTAAAQYRIDVTLSGGSVFFLAQNGVFHPGTTGTWNPVPPFFGFLQSKVIEPGDAYGAGPWLQSITTAQLLSLYNSRNTPLTLAQIAGPLTIYTKLSPFVGSPKAFSATAGMIAKLSTPSDALVGFDNSSALCVGTNRAVRVSKATVTAVLDSNANEVGSGYSIVGAGQGTAYATGASVIAIDIPAVYPDSCLPKSMGQFSSATCFYGIHAYTSLIEAAAGGGANMAAFGL